MDRKPTLVRYYLWICYCILKISYTVLSKLSKVDPNPYNEIRRIQIKTVVKSSQIELTRYSRDDIY